MTSSPRSIIDPVWIIGFTGHRPDPARGRTRADLEKIRPQVRAELLQLKTLAQQQGGRAELLCGVAAGADIIAAQEAEGLGMAVHVILPMPQSLYEQDFEGADLRDDLQAARHFIQQADAGSGGATFRVAGGSHLRNECYYDLGLEIAHASDALLAVWDGAEAEALHLAAKNGTLAPGRGGTRDVMQVAGSEVLPYVKQGLFAQGMAWLPKPVRVIHLHTGVVSGSTEGFAGEKDAGLQELRALQRAAEAEKRPEVMLDSVQSLMDFTDYQAIDWAAKLRRGLLCSSALHFTASLTAAISAGMQSHQVKWLPPFLAAIELALVSAAITLMLWSRWKRAQARWLELRLATELVRGLVDAGRLLDPLFPVCREVLPAWRRFCLSVGLTVWRDPRSQPGGPGDTPEQKFEKSRAVYLEKRIQNQLEHFDRKDPHHKHWWHPLAHYAAPATATLAVVFAALALFRKWEVSLLSEAPESTFLSSLLFTLLPIALPLAAGALASLQTVTDMKRRAQVYPEMQERLRGARDLLPHLRTEASVRRFVRRTEELLLDELVGWYAAAKGISH